MCVCVCVPPHGVCDTHRGPKEGGEAEESDEDGGHLADSVWLPGGLTVHHHTALCGQKRKKAGVKSHFHHNLLYYGSTELVTQKYTILFN